MSWKSNKEFETNNSVAISPAKSIWLGKGHAIVLRDFLNRHYPPEKATSSDTRPHT